MCARADAGVASRSAAAAERLSQYVGAKCSKKVSEEMLYMDTKTGKRSKEKTGTPPLAKSIIKALIKELTNSVTEAITLVWAETLSPMLSDVISNSIKEETTTITKRDVENIVSNAAHKNLRITIPTALEKIVPAAVLQPATRGAVQTMSRALSHALAPTLTFTLAHNAPEHLACSNCRAFGTYCNQCDMGPDENSIRLYTATHYASFYMDYHAGEEGGG